MKPKRKQCCAIDVELTVTVLTVHNLSFRFVRVRKLVAHNLIDRFDWLSSRKMVCFVHCQGQKYTQKHETKRLAEFHNHLHASSA